MRVYSVEIVFYNNARKLIFVFPAFLEAKLKENLAATCPIAKLTTEASRALLTWAATFQLLLKKVKINFPPLSVRQTLVLLLNDEIGL